MTIRHTVDSITSDALDALYEQLEAAEAGEVQRQLATAREALASATTRAARAEAAIARVRALHQEWDADPGHCAHCQDGMGTPLPWPCPTNRALDGEQPAPEPCDGRPCTGTGCSHELAAAALTTHDHDAGLYTAPTLAATQATDDACCGKPSGAVCVHDISVPKQQPREHCGDLMPAWVAGPRSECVLPPGHQGSHADDRCARWWYDPLSEAVGNHTDPSRVVHTTSNTPPTENT